MEKKVAVVTGVSSGIGRAIAALLAESGYRVFGTVRAASAEMPPGVERVVLDVRDEASIRAAISGIFSLTNRIDILVNNAGSGLVGAIEEIDTEEAQALFDVNFFGAVRMTRAVLGAMRAQRNGRILFIGSVAGFLPIPFGSYYSASKHALEGYSESLDHEMRLMGVRAILIEPYFMKTRIDRSSPRAAHPIQVYANSTKRAAESLTTSVEHGEDPSVVARMVVKALAARRPRLRYPVGRNARMLALLRRLMPGALFDRALRLSLHLDG
jgi:NAD(P)-dependent dehydrogenase (short-subunit alcohol dehydrogenase family)